jgi:hypothetical protein
MNLAKLTLLACPSLLAITLLAPNPAHANQRLAKPTDTVSSLAQPREIVFERPTSKSPIPEVTAQQPNNAIDNDDCSCSGESPMLNFTDAEAKAAINRYGCDCAGCMNAVRQLQGKLPLL